MKRSRESIELLTIPKPGEGIHPRKIQKFRIVAWGERLYVCLDDVARLEDFCRASLSTNRAAKTESGLSCRESDANKPQTGLPRLPWKVWVRFLLDEVAAKNKGDRGVADVSF